MKSPAEFPAHPLACTGAGLRLDIGREGWEGMSDADLARAAAVADHQGKLAFVEIVRRYQTAVCAVAWSVTGRISLSDDIAQETFFKAWKRLATLRDPAKLKAWLTRIAHDCAVDALHREKPHSLLEDEDAGLAAMCTSPSPDAAAAAAEEEAMVWSSLAAMAENLRTPLVLFYREGQSVAAVAAAMDLSEEAVRQRLSRGRQALRAAVESRIESVLGRVQPSALLIVTIAAGIGLLTKPASLAAGVTAAVATGSAGAAAGGVAGAGAATTGSVAGAGTAAAGALGISTFMTTTTWLAAAIAMAAFLPLGWKAGGLTGASGAAKVDASLTKPAFGDDPFAVWQDSRLLAEWRRLHEIHGSSAAAMSAIYTDIQSGPDKFRRDSLNIALMAEWAATDPEGAFQFLWAEKKNTAHAALMMKEWLKADPDMAAEKFLASLPGTAEMVTVCLNRLADRAPQYFAAVLSSLPESPAANGPVAEALERFARQDLQAATESLPLLKGGTLLTAQTTLASLMTEKNPASALEWAKGQTSDEARKATVSAVFLAWAKSDPAAALANTEDIPESQKIANAIINKVAETDLAMALSLYCGNKEKFNGNWADGLDKAVSLQFSDQPVATLKILQGQPEEMQSKLLDYLYFTGTDPASQQAAWNWVLQSKPEGWAAKVCGKMISDSIRDRTGDGLLRLKTSLPSGRPQPVRTRGTLPTNSMEQSWMISWISCQPKRGAPCWPQPSKIPCGIPCPTSRSGVRGWRNCLPNPARTLPGNLPNRWFTGTRNWR